MVLLQNQLPAHPLPYHAAHTVRQTFNGAIRSYENLDVTFEALIFFFWSFSFSGFSIFPSFTQFLFGLNQQAARRPVFHRPCQISSADLHLQVEALLLRNAFCHPCASSRQSVMTSRAASYGAASSLSALSLIASFNLSFIKAGVSFSLPLHPVHIPVFPVQLPSPPPARSLRR